MGVETLVLVGLSVSLMLLSRLFLKKGNTDSPIQNDDKPTTLAKRGASINYVIGTRLIGYNFGWADDDNRFTREEKTGEASGGKGLGIGGGSQDITQTVWFSAGWHVLAVGPASALLEIREGGKVVWAGPVTRDSTPSGTLIEAEGVGTFRIYWGELNQPVDEILDIRMGIRSRWPGVCHIVWVEKRLGTSQAWPQIEYLLTNEYDCIGTIPAPYVLQNEACKGINGAHVLAQLLAADFPYGGGLGVEGVAIEPLVEGAAICIEEHLACNILIQDGETLDKAIQGVLGDLGVFLSEQNGRLYSKFIRSSSDALPSFSDDVVTSPDPEITVSPPDLAANRIVYTFKDQDYNFRDNDIKTDNDAYIEDYSRYREATQSLYCPTHVTVASSIALRRTAEGFGDEANVKVQAIRGAGLLIPGQAFILPGVGPLLVMGIARSATSPVVTLDCFLDSITLATDAAIIDAGNLNPTPLATLPGYDLAFSFFEVPSELSGGDNRVVVFRIRRSITEIGAFVWASGDNASYVLYGQQIPASTGGILLESVSDNTPDIIDIGPLFEVLGPDIGIVRDLTADPTNWFGGSQIAVINNEAFFLRAIDASPEVIWLPSTGYSVPNSVVPAGVPTGLRYVCTTSGTSGSTEPAWPKQRLGSVVDGSAVWQARGLTYRLSGMVRARLDSEIAAHVMADIVYISPITGLRFFAGPVFLPGNDVCIKTQPYSRRSATSITGAPFVCRTIVGDGTGLIFLVNNVGDFFSTSTGDRLILS